MPFMDDPILTKPIKQHKKNKLKSSFVLTAIILYHFSCSTSYIPGLYRQIRITFRDNEREIIP